MYQFLHNISTFYDLFPALVFTAADGSARGAFGGDLAEAHKVDYDQHSNGMQFHTLRQ